MFFLFTESSSDKSQNSGQGVGDMLVLPWQEKSDVDSDNLDNNRSWLTPLWYKSIILCNAFAVPNRQYITCWYEIKVNANPVWHSVCQFSNDGDLFLLPRFLLSLTQLFFACKLQETVTHAMVQLNVLKLHMNLKLVQIFRCFKFLFSIVYILVILLCWITEDNKAAHRYIEY